MGFFDFLKKNKKSDILQNENEPVSTIKHSGKSLNEIYAEKQNLVSTENPDKLFDFIKIYSEYIVRFIGMQMQNNYSPIAAYEKANGEIIGYLYIAEDMSYNLSIEEVISNMETEFEKRLGENNIKSYAIFYHSKFNEDNNHDVADNGNEFKAISIKYKASNFKGFLGLPYFFEEDKITFKGISGFSREQNNRILNTQLTEGKDYFQERFVVEAQITENEIGLKIKKVNNGNLGDMWGGIFGFEKLDTQSGRQLLTENSVFVLNTETIKSNDEVLISEINYGSIIFRGVKTIDNKTRTIFPVVKTNYFIEVENKQINEWDNINNLEAVISGSGRDTFGLTYFATDYAIHKDKYKTNKKLNIELSGVIYVLDISDMHEKQTEEGPNFSDNFTMYMPNKEMAEFGCFDFVGKLESFREISVSEDKSVKAYILKVKLITNEDFEDFFTIEMFVNKENMRFENLTIGMKLTGMFQLQGQIKE